MELEKIIREIYRIPVSQSDNISAVVDGTGYEIVNLGGSGIGISVPESEPLAIDDRLHDVVLTIDGEPLHLKGKVIHLTPHGADNNLCGIHFIEMDQVSERKLLSCIYRIRSRLFTNN